MLMVLLFTLLPQMMITPYAICAVTSLYAYAALDTPSAATAPSAAADIYAMT